MADHTYSEYRRSGLGRVKGSVFRWILTQEERTLGNFCPSESLVRAVVKVRPIRILGSELSSLLAICTVWNA